jgi:hypothetical protein
LIGGRELEILDADELVRVECDLEHAEKAAVEAFPDKLVLQMRSVDGFRTHLFFEVHVRAEGAGASLAFECRYPNEYWDGRRGLATLLSAIRDQVQHYPGFRVTEIELEDDWKDLVLETTIVDGTVGEGVRRSARTLLEIVRAAEVALDGLPWKSEYGYKEDVFCTELLAPLLRRMGFLSVRYLHGTREYGKDFTFSELTPFGHLRHYGLQAKAGDVSGEVNAAIDEIIGQAKDAFAVPYVELGSKEQRFISTFVIAISGRFTANAKEKIVHKLPPGLIGSVYFLDRENLLELVERFWRKVVHGAGHADHGETSETAGS